MRKLITILTPIALLTLSGCVQNRDGSYSITAQSIYNKIVELKTRADVESDFKSINESQLTPKEGVNVAEFRNAFNSYEKLQNLSKTNKKVAQCENTIQQYQIAEDNKKDFYQKHHDTISDYQADQMLGQAFTAMAFLACAGDEDCNEELSQGNNAKKLAKGVLGNDLGFAEASLQSQGYSKESIQYVKNTVAEYNVLEKKAASAKQKAQSCSAYIQNEKQKYLSQINPYLQNCIANNWFNLKTETMKENSCLLFIEKGYYKRFI